jgi:hypothetical protein
MNHVLHRPLAAVELINFGLSLSTSRPLEIVFSSSGFGQKLLKPRLLISITLALIFDELSSIN